MAPGNAGNSGQQPRPGVGQPGFQPTDLQRNAYTRALRQMLRPHTVHRFLLIRHLRLTNWDVQAAHDSLIAERNARLGLAPPVAPAPALAPTPAQIPGAAPTAAPAPAAVPTAAASQDAPEAYRVIDMMRYNATNPESERRRTVVVFRDHIAQRANDSAALSISQSVLLLQLADWDLGQALDEWQGLDDAVDRLHVAFDRMRSSEGNKLADPKKDKARSERQDERLALLLNLTGRADWRSLQLFLQILQFNLVQAAIDWFKFGIPVAGKAKDKKLTRKDGKCNLIPVPSDKDVAADPVDKRWAPEPAFYRRVSDFTRNELVPLPPLHEDGRNTRPFGFLIHPERGTIQAGRFFVEDNFVVEYISKGKYRFGRFQMKTVGKGGAQFKWPKFGLGHGVVENSDSESDPTTSKKVKFDFSNRTHVSKLNAWRRQQFARITGILRRKGSQRWEPIENARLHSLIKAYHKANEPLKMTLKGLNNIAKELNEAFVGTRPGAASAIRGERTPTSVGTQMRRFFPVVRDYGVKADDAWFAKSRDVSKEGYKARQEQDLLDGSAAYKNWDPTKERPAVTDGPTDGDADLAEYDDNIVAGDDEATKERKRFETRSEKKAIKEARRAAAAARAEQAKDAAAGTTGDDSLVDISKLKDGGPDDGSEDEGGNEGGEEDDEDYDGADETPAKRKKRKH